MHEELDPDLLRIAMDPALVAAMNDDFSDYLTEAAMIASGAVMLPTFKENPTSLNVRRLHRSMREPLLDALNWVETVRHVLKTALEQRPKIVLPHNVVPFRGGV